MSSVTQKYRPKKFSDMVGQIPAVNSVKSAINSGVLPPAYIAYGLQGCGKTSIATLIAMSLNCPNKEGIEPCGECSTCKAILSSQHEMFMELDAATNSGVADMRELMATVRYVVPHNSYKVIVIDECHSLTKQAWQAALKTIERPPERVLFIFCTTEYQSVPATIKSRCVQLQFAGVPDSVLVKTVKSILKEESVEYDDEAVDLIAKNARGSVRDAQSILEGFIRSGKVSSQSVKSVYQTIDPNTIMSYFNAVKSKQIKSASNVAGNWIKLGCSPQVIIGHLVEYLSDMIMDWNIKDKNIRVLVKSQRDKLGEYQISRWIEVLTQFLSFIRNFPMPYTLLINILTIKLYSAIEGGTPKKNVSEKPQKISGGEKEKDILRGCDKSKEPSPSPLDKNKVANFQNLCGGTTISVDPNMLRLSFRHKNGNIIDVVSTPDMVQNSYYILGSDLDLAIVEYPKNMKNVIKTK